ncbi:MAG: MBL fold metallo-hydrolase [Agriterribacter sp.]
MIAAVKKNEALLNEVREYEQDDSDFHIWWLGQSGYLLLWQGKKILIDPYLSDSLTKKYANTNKQHIRMSERVMDPALLRDIQIVSSSHNHTDHLDAETLIPLIQHNPGIQFIIPEANRTFVADRIQMPSPFPVGLTEDESITIGDFIFYGIAAAHNAIDRDENGRCKYLGFIIRFGKWTIYHSGDTLWYEGLAEKLSSFNIDLALLPINGNDPSRGVAGNLDTDEAAKLASVSRIKHVIPCHYNMFTFNTADPEIFAEKAILYKQAYTVLPHGGHWSSRQLL